MMGLTYEDAVRCGIGHLWPTTFTAPPGVEIPPAPSRIVEDGMNKTEARFARGLDHMKSTGEIKDWAFEPERFRLADRTFLKIDFRVTMSNNQNIFVEVKGGFIRDDAIVKAKVVAEMHPYVFFLAVYKNRTWTITRLPSRNWGAIDARISWSI